MTELLPCPFCGGEAELVEADYGMFNTGYAVYCHSCCTKVGVTGRLGEAYEWSPIYDTEAEAIAAWNSRADDEWEIYQRSVPATEENMAMFGWVRERTCTNGIKPGRGVMPMLYCSNCGCYTTLNKPDNATSYGESFMDWPFYCGNCGSKVVSGIGVEP